MKTNINQTLKKKLITSPNPKCNEREFWQLYDRMFGDKHDIVDFLDATETQKKFELSKRIVTRIAFESNFPPAMELLDYIYDFEGTVRYQRSIKHVGRDHYIHLCYLYLFGIYVFFYYTKANIQLHSSLSLVRFSNGISEESSFVKNFISVWKTFVMYHDIAYQFEYLGKNDHEYSELEKDEYEKTCRLFRPVAIKTSIMKGIKMRALATLVALNNTIDDPSNKPANTLAYIKRNKEQFEKRLYDMEIGDFLQEYENKRITFMKYVKAGDDIKYYLTLFKYSDFFAVVKENSNIKLIVGEKFFFADKAISDKMFIKKIINDRTIIFSDEWNIQFPGYTIEYYGINLSDTINKFLRDNSIPRSVLSGFGIGSRTALRMKDIVFECYLSCYNYLMREADSSKDFEELEEICKKELFRIIDNDYARERQVEKQDEEYEYVQTFLDDYLSHIRRILNLDRGQRDYILLATVEQFKKENNEKRNFQSMYQKVSDKIDQYINMDTVKAECEDEGDVFQLYGVDKQELFFRLMSNDDRKYLTSSMQKAIKDEGRSLEEILSDYHLDYSGYDHGVTASKVFILHFYYYQNIIKNAADSVLVRMCFNMPNLNDEDELRVLVTNKYMLDYSETIRQVVYAILVHNLYPDNFTNAEFKRMKINSETNPFAYFCMICDALQDWGRPFNINPVEENYPLFLDALKVNIKFDNYINVRFKEDNPAIIEKRLKPFVHELDSYLDGAGDMMRVKFI